MCASSWEDFPEIIAQSSEISLRMVFKVTKKLLDTLRHFICNMEIDPLKPMKSVFAKYSIRRVLMLE